VTLSVALSVCVSAALISAAKVMCCIQCSLVSFLFIIWLYVTVSVYFAHILLLVVDDGDDDDDDND